MMILDSGLLFGPPCIFIGICWHSSVGRNTQVQIFQGDVRKRWFPTADSA